MAFRNSPLTLTIPSDLCFLPIARTFVESVCRVGGLEQTVTDAIILATNEAVSNVIRHAHRGHPEALIQLQCSYSPEGIEICLLDEGDPFDLNSVPNMDPAEIRLGGRGVFLMRSLMDELTCQPRDEKGNTLRMVKRCQKNLPSEGTE